MARRITDIVRLSNRIDRMIDRLFGHWLDRWLEMAPELELEHVPPLDLAETDDSYIARVEIPGVRKDDIEVTLRGRRLIIRGKKQREEREEGEGLIRVERYHGEFRRIVTLPSEVDADNASATYKDGVLEIRLPKIEKEKGKRIEIKAV